MVPRENAKPVMTYLYRPVGGGANLPVVFNVHGGAWVGGDALLLDTQSQEMADCLGVNEIVLNEARDVRLTAMVQAVGADYGEIKNRPAQYSFCPAEPTARAHRGRQSLWPIPIYRRVTMPLCFVIL